MYPPPVPAHATVRKNQPKISGWLLRIKYRLEKATCQLNLRFSSKSVHYGYFQPEKAEGLRMVQDPEAYSSSALYEREAVAPEFKLKLAHPMVA